MEFTRQQVLSFAKEVERELEGFRKLVRSELQRDGEDILGRIIEKARPPMSTERFALKMALAAQGPREGPELTVERARAFYEFLEKPR